HIREPHMASTMERGGGRNGLRVRAEPNPSGTLQMGRQDWEGGVNPLGKLPGSVWSIPSEPLQVPPHLGVDHFAAYPTGWPERLILGWSPSGICVGCGEGRRPVIAGGGISGGLLQRRGNASAGYKDSARHGGDRGLLANISGRERRLHQEPYRIAGEACAC